MKKYWCDRKARAASAQSFALWQQATMRLHAMITLLHCSCHIYMGFIFRAHPVRGESHIQSNANREVATTSPLFYDEPNRSQVVFVKAALDTTFTSSSQHHFDAIGKPERQCAKLHTVAASNNRNHTPWSLYYCLVRATNIWGYVSRTSRSWRIAHST